MALPSPPPEVRRDNSTTGLAPKFRAALNLALAETIIAGYDPTIFETVRSQDRQTYLYGFGREYDDGRGVITNSRDSDESWHGFGLAADIVSRSKLWNAPDEFWKMLGRQVKAQGLVWGGDWPHFPDRPHVQWGAHMRRSPSPRAARLVAEGGLERLWEEVGAL